MAELSKIRKNGVEYNLKDATAREAASKAVKTINGNSPDANGNVEITVSGSDSGQNSNGLSDAASALLITILRNGVYSTDQSANITALENALVSGGGDVPDEPDEPDVPVVKTYAISNELVNVSSSNAATSVNENASYTATLTAADGYELDTVSVLMGGVDVTADVYADGVISIASVTGNVEITASASMAETGVVLPNDGLLAFWDLRNATSTTDWTPTIGDTSAYKLQSANTWDAQTVDSYGVLLQNGTYGGAKIQKTGEDGAFADMEHGTEFTIVTMFYGGFVAPDNYYGLDGFKAFWPNPRYVKTDGTTASGTRTQNIENQLGTDEYATIIVRVNENLLDIFYKGEVVQNADGSTYDDFAHWVNSGLTIRSVKNHASGKLTALAVYDKALTDIEIVELCEYLKTLEVTA